MYHTDHSGRRWQVACYNLSCWELRPQIWRSSQRLTRNGCNGCTEPHDVARSQIEMWCLVCLYLCTYDTSIILHLYNVMKWNAMQCNILYSIVLCSDAMQCIVCIDLQCYCRHVQLVKLHCCSLKRWIVLIFQFQSGAQIVQRCRNLCNNLRWWREFPMYLNRSESTSPNRFKCW